MDAQLIEQLTALLNQSQPVSTPQPVPAQPSASQVSAPPTHPAQNTADSTAETSGANAVQEIAYKELYESQRAELDKLKKELLEVKTANAKMAIQGSAGKAPDIGDLLFDFFGYGSQEVRDL